MRISRAVPQFAKPRKPARVFSMAAGTYLLESELNMLTLEETKLHCRIDHNDEDALLAGLMATATAATADYLNMPLEQMTTTVPSPIKSAALLLVADLYQNREAQTERPLSDNKTFERLLNPYRAYA